VFEFEAKPSTDDLTQTERIGKALVADEKQFVSVPDTVKFRLESAQNSGAEALLNTIKYYRLLMLQTMLADFINLGVGSTGSWALGSDKSQLFLMAVDGFLDRMATVVNRFAVPRLMAYGVHRAAARPSLVHTRVEKPALAQLGSWLQQVSSLLTWTEEDESWIRHRTGMPTLGPGQGDRGTRGQGDEEKIPDESGRPAGRSEEEGEEMAEFAAYEGRGPERAGVEEGLLNGVQKFLDGQLRRIRAAVARGRTRIGEDDAFWAEEETLFRASFLDRLLKAVMELIELVISDAQEQVGGGADWAGTNAEAAAWARGYVGELITRVTETTRAAVRETTAAWIETGAKLPDLVKVLKPTFGERRAQLIAATEVTRAFDEANDLTRQRLGLPRALKKAPAHPGCRCATRAVLLPNGEWVVVWYTVRGDRVCKQPLSTPWGRVNGCRDLHGMIVSEKYGGRRLSEVRAEVGR